MVSSCVAILSPTPGTGYLWRVGSGGDGVQAHPVLGPRQGAGKSRLGPSTLGLVALGLAGE